MLRTIDSAVDDGYLPSLPARYFVGGAPLSHRLSWTCLEPFGTMLLSILCVLVFVAHFVFEKGTSFAYAGYFDWWHNLGERQRDLVAGNLELFNWLRSFLRRPLHPWPLDSLCSLTFLCLLRRACQYAFRKWWGMRAVGCTVSCWSP